MAIALSRFVLVTAVAVVTLVPVSAVAQTSPGPPALEMPAASQAQTPAADPLAVANQAIAKGDYAAAQTIVNAYLKDNPDNPQALFAAGNAYLGLKQYDDAAKSYLAAIKTQPPFWPAHKNLVIVYAAEGKWTEFDQERALLRDATAKGEDGLNSKVPDVIDVIYAGA
jgi:tetratricopeptide (TPR) repeat protein